MGEAREVDGGEGEVGHYKEGPYGSEEEEVVLGGGVDAGTSEIPGCD